ncbi:hypothetical protein CHLRE_03g156400v5 [Chlamydomonas reinhardtii]|uniref:Methyltransferase type 11 domain-containing protein n=1 Tax=Chlamydomonas reinhardtii TaxID=3055 RepID=A0A2K3DW21_CHLRE|nr:uncharacterized protein CHLRE_03g156400v5 [Chlamydomonas reinhardtii]PNW84730.1 hypothetical protein CHLRE_03g156400v5 [Chlamydomonas reinhardtii]
MPLCLAIAARFFGGLSGVRAVPSKSQALARHLFTGVARAHASCTASTGRAYAMPTSASAPTSAPSTAAASASSAAADPPADHSQADPRTLFLDADQTSRYAAHRPHYPPQLYDLLYTHAFPGRHPTPGPPFPDLAVADVATGSGQALGPMPEHFGRCVALDVSPAQLQELPAPLRARVAVQLGDAHATGLAAGSLDLVTVGQALHWFRFDEFYRECRRILKPTGALAAFTYGFGRLCGFPGAQALYGQLHSGTLGPYWAEGRKIVEAEYVGIEPGPEHFGQVVRLRAAMPSDISLDELAGYISSWSAYRAYLRANPGQPDPLQAFRAQCEAGLRQQAEAGAAGAGAGGGEGQGQGAGQGAAVPQLRLERDAVLLLALRPVPLE